MGWVRACAIHNHIQNGIIIVLYVINVLVNIWNVLCVFCCAKDVNARLVTSPPSANARTANVRCPLAEVSRWSFVFLRCSIRGSKHYNVGKFSDDEI